MRVGVELIRHGTDMGDWMCGYQLAINGQLSPMFDLHKSRIREAADYEQLLTESAETLIRSMGAAKSTAIPVPSRQ